MKSPPPQANGVAAIEAADAELASFTEMQTAPRSPWATARYGR